MVIGKNNHLPLSSAQMMYSRQSKCFNMSSRIVGITIYAPTYLRLVPTNLQSIQNLVIFLKMIKIFVLQNAHATASKILYESCLTNA